MLRLYQYTFGYQPHYVVAQNYAHAEALIRSQRGFEHSEIKRIDCLGCYVIGPWIEESPNDPAE